MQLNLPVRFVPQIGPSFANRLKKLNILTIRDLLFHFPYRYEDFAKVKKIYDAVPFERATIQGQVVSIENIYTRHGKKIQKAKVSDGEGLLEVTWFNQPYLVKTLPPQTHVSLSGKIEVFAGRYTMTSPEYEKVQSAEYKVQNTLHTGRLVPVYPETQGVSSKWLRGRISSILPLCLSQIEDFLPPVITGKYRLIPQAIALSKIHFPKDFSDVEKARRRLGFDELFETRLIALARRKNWKRAKVAHTQAVNQERILEFIDNLPFALTNSQKRGIKEILTDLARSEPMNRLLQGDVGSGKTVVAAVACYVSFLNGFQSAVMAPTQILAQQHYKTLKALLEPFGVQIELLISSKLQATSYKLQADIIVGTQALIQKGVAFDRLALVVIDEQHRFGVLQRALLTKKGEQSFSPHVLTMTATPIPRTVALVLYGDLDLSTLDELPVGRIPIKTWVVPPQKRDAAYKWIREKVASTDEQAFIVCPLIEESEKETMKSVRAATKEFENLSKKIFADLRLALLHGKVKAKEKEEIMEKMKKGEIDILVATPVVEVGIDMPNATIMMIEGAERFGLAQLHQLRGRVGRGNKQSYCLLFTDSIFQTALTRLKSMEKTLSGAVLAEIDLKLRGPGEVFGTAQHGFPEFKIASLADSELIKITHQAAEELLPKLASYPKLHEFVKDKELVAAN